MTPAQLQEKVRTQLGWRIGENQARYILARIGTAEDQAPFPIQASDARTGHALRLMLDPTQLAGPAPQAQMEPAESPIPAPLPQKEPAKQANSNQFLLFPM